MTPATTAGSAATNLLRFITRRREKDADPHDIGRHVAVSLVFVRASGQEHIAGRSLTLKHLEMGADRLPFSIRPVGGIAKILAQRQDEHEGRAAVEHQTRSMMVAVPMPAPMQSVTSAVFRSRRSSSSSTVPKIIAPVAPSGWPIAMAPPLTLILS